VRPKLVGDVGLAILTASQEAKQQSFLLDAVQDALIVRDLEDRIRFWNKGAERLYGWCAQEVVGKNVYDFLLPDGPQRFEQQGRILAETGEWFGELRQVTKAHRSIVVESRWKLQRDEFGQPKAVLFVNKDITEKKMLEDEILHSQRIESIERLAIAIVHDLNNVLPAMLISIRGLRQQHIDLEGWRDLESSQFHVEQAVQVITQLLSLTKETKEEPLSIDLRRLIKETEEILKTAFPRTIEIKTVIASDVHTIAGKATHLYQVLLNLCLNARDAMPFGGILTIEAGNFVVETINAQLPPEAKPGEYVLIKVTDTGVGIPPEIIGKIFEPFFTTKERDKGTGLGLFTVLRIVRGCNGFIDLLSDDQRGTQFCVYLPAQSCFAA